jgi:hypothetical protein
MRRGNERVRSFPSLHPLCNVSIASGANVYVRSCRDGAGQRVNIAASGASQRHSGRSDQLARRCLSGQASEHTHLQSASE